VTPWSCSSLNEIRLSNDDRMMLCTVRRYAAFRGCVAIATVKQKIVNVQCYDKQYAQKYFPCFLSFFFLLICHDIQNCKLRVGWSDGQTPNRVPQELGQRPPLIGNCSARNLKLISFYSIMYILLNKDLYFIYVNK